MIMVVLGDVTTIGSGVKKKQRERERERESCKKRHQSLLYSSRKHSPRVPGQTPGKGRMGLWRMLRLN